MGLLTSAWEPEEGDVDRKLRDRHVRGWDLFGGLEGDDECEDREFEEVWGMDYAQI